MPGDNRNRSRRQFHGGTSARQPVRRRIAGFPSREARAFLTPKGPGKWAVLKFLSRQFLHGNTSIGVEKRQRDEIRNWRRLQRDVWGPHWGSLLRAPRTENSFWMEGGWRRRI